MTSYHTIVYISDLISYNRTIVSTSLAPVAHFKQKGTSSYHTSALYLYSLHQLYYSIICNTIYNTAPFRTKAYSTSYTIPSDHNFTNFSAAEITTEQPTTLKLRYHRCQPSEARNSYRSLIFPTAKIAGPPLWL